MERSTVSETIYLVTYATVWESGHTGTGHYSQPFDSEAAAWQFVTDYAESAWAKYKDCKVTFEIAKFVRVPF